MRAVTTLARTRPCSHIVCAPMSAEWPVAKTATKGVAVRALQRLLLHRGADVEVDGSFGPATVKAVKAFQSATGLEADGAVGTETWSKLVVPVRCGQSGEPLLAVQELLGIAADGEVRTRDGEGHATLPEPRPPRGRRRGGAAHLAAARRRESGPGLESAARRGRSSVGRASASQAEGRGFEARRPLSRRPCKSAYSWGRSVLISTEPQERVHTAGTFLALPRSERLSLLYAALAVVCALVFSPHSLLVRIASTTWALTALPMGSGNEDRAFPCIPLPFPLGSPVEGARALVALSV